MSKKDYLSKNELEKNRWYLGHTRGSFVMYWDGKQFRWFRLFYEDIEVKFGDHWDDGGPCQPMKKIDFDFYKEVTGVDDNES